MATMKKVPTQLIVGLGIVLIGSGIVGGEYLLVKWFPQHKEDVTKETLAPVTYKNVALGIDMQVAGGIYGKAETFPGGARIFSPKIWSTGPSLTITSRPNPDKIAEFTPQELAIWETDGSQHMIPRYDFEHTRINDRDAVLISQYKNHAMLLTARIISPDHIVEANCTPGSEDESLYMQACKDSVLTIKVSGPPSPKPPPMGGMEVLPSVPGETH